MKRSIVLTVAALVSFVTLASAQPKDDEDNKKTKPPRVKTLNMGAEDITSDVPTGELIPIGVRDFGKSSSLLRIRHDFIDMILKAAEDMS